ncbi:hypothetical protein BD324DRAFT_641541 [Kockovaella imperatae]|uniref:RRM domain-containing protein n=1 Tax=Kockovaella imperatae TaxID=4999 RepID=A0A1Y1ULE1_9TREE|nr:hypothetical protein BD324DRAFT_641541 [Kockovaella imperatae]ORX38324.1 hypothetical protein BD324DRAFT_641541 [Kockovaella imperatae]
MSGQDYSEEQRLAAYYRQQGYDEKTIAQMTASSSSGSTSYTNGYSGAAGGASAVGQPYHQPDTTQHAAMPASVARQIFDSDLSQQSSAYGMDGQLNVLGGPSSGPSKPVRRPVAPGQKRETVIRKGNGRTWEDPTLIDWDPKWFRLFVGDVSNDVSERTLDEAFNKYPSYCKSKVVRDRLSLKAKYGFIAFKDPEDFLRAWKENDGKYIGNRPIKLSKVKDDKYGTIETVQVGARKAKYLDQVRKNHGKPLDGRPTPW